MSDSRPSTPDTGTGTGTAASTAARTRSGSGPAWNQPAAGLSSQWADTLSSTTTTGETLRNSDTDAASFSSPSRRGSRSRPRCHSIDAIRPAPGATSLADASGTSTPTSTHYPHHLPMIQEGVSNLAPLQNRILSLQANMDSNNNSNNNSVVDPVASTAAAPAPRRGMSGGAVEPLPRASAAAAALASQPTTRARGHSVGVRLPPVRQMTRHNFDIEAQKPPSRSSADGGRRSSISLDITLPEAHDSAIADHNGALHDDVVGLLDCVDSEVGTVNHLQNVTNGLMFPHIPALWSRRPHLTLNSRTDEYAVLPTLVAEPSEIAGIGTGRDGRSRGGTISRYVPGMGRVRRASAPAEIPLVDVEDKSDGEDKDASSSKDGKDHGAEALVEDVANEHELDKHVRRMLQRKNRKEKARRALRGLWAYLKTPMGAITAIYGFLVAFWGAAIVLFLLGWIPTSSKDTQDKWVEISSQVENGLFTITGVGLIPWRAIDTYRMSIIWTMRMRMFRRRKAKGLPPAKDADDLPAQEEDELLTEQEAAKLKHNQDKFAESQTWYRPHETATHRAFPAKMALWNTILMDGNSFFQCILCGTMWGLNRHQRPAWSTGILIPASFLCGIFAAVLIWRGGVRSKKTEDVKAKLRKALGVDEKVPEAVKHPRRATVSGTNPLPGMPPVGTTAFNPGDMLDMVTELPEHDLKAAKSKSPASRPESL